MRRAKGIVFKLEKRNLNAASEAGTSRLKFLLVRQRDRKWLFRFPGRTVRPGGMFRKTKLGIWEVAAALSNLKLYSRKSSLMGKAPKLRCCFSPAKAQPSTPRL